MHVILFFYNRVDQKSRACSYLFDNPNVMSMSDCVRSSQALDLFVFSNNPLSRDLESNGAGLSIECAL